MKTMMITAALLFATMLNMTAQTSEQNLVYNTEKIDDHMSVVFAYGKEEDTLFLKLKNVHEYDEQGRMVRREVMKWNPWKQKWMNLKCWTYDYAEGRITIELSLWNKRKHCYNPACQRLEYDLVGSEVFRVTNYSRKPKQQDFQLANSYLLVNNVNEMLQTNSK